MRDRGERAGDEERGRHVFSQSPNGTEDAKSWRAKKQKAADKYTRGRGREREGMARKGKVSGRGSGRGKTMDERWCGLRARRGE